MKFFFGILLVALVALVSAEEAKKEINQENAVPVTETESELNTRDRRSLFYGAYAAPVVAAPIAAAPVVAAPIAAPIAAAPVAYATRVGYPYGALRYAAYGAYAPYVPAVRYL